MREPRRRLAAFSAIASALVGAACLFVSSAAQPATDYPPNGSTRYTLKRASSNVDPATLCRDLVAKGVSAKGSSAVPAYCSNASAPMTLDHCVELTKAGIELEGLTRTSGSSVYQCVMTVAFPVGFKPNPAIVGQASASMPGFGASASGTVTVERVALLTWSPPTRNTDGSALTNLSGYQVNYGRAPDALVHSMQISQAAATSASVIVPSAGDWYFEVRAIAGSNQSAPSNRGFKRFSQ